LKPDEKSASIVKVRKRELAISLQSVKGHPEPKLALEQYTIPAELASEVLFEACYVHGDIEGKTVADLGTGTGRLALGAAMLGAEYVAGVDVDRKALGAALENSKQLGLEVDWILGKIEVLKGPVDTVLMNPPFGTRTPHTDLRFLETALRLGNVTYSIHKSSTRGFLHRWLQEKGSRFEILMETKMEIPHQFPFHRRKRSSVDVDVYRIEQVGQSLRI